MKPLTIDQARKAVQEAQQPPRLLIKIGYTSFVLPHDAGIKLLQAMQSAEIYKHKWSEPVVIKPLGSDNDTDVDISYLSQKEYELIKMANLMGLDVNDLKNQERKPDDIPF